MALPIPVNWTPEQVAAFESLSELWVAYNNVLQLAHAIGVDTSPGAAHVQSDLAAIAQQYWTMLTTWQTTEGTTT